MIHPYSAKHQIVSRPARSYDDGVAIVFSEAFIAVDDKRLSKSEWQVIMRAISEGILTVRVQRLKPIAEAAP